MNWALSPRVLPWLIAGAAALVLATAHALESMGYAPCELCLRQRVPYWIATALALCAGAAAMPRLGLGWLSSFLMAAVTVTFAVGLGLAIQHVGVEQGWWKSKCSGAGAGQITDLLNTMGKTPIVSCDEKRPFLFGLTLATYNLFISTILAAAAASLPLRALRLRLSKATA